MALKMLLMLAILGRITVNAVTPCGGIGQKCCNECVGDATGVRKQKCESVCKEGSCIDSVCSIPCANADAACSTPDDCCDNVPICFQDVCSQCGEKSCNNNNNDECCPGAPYCFGSICVRIPGRPYNLLNKYNLHANIINNCDYDVNQEYINALLAEHASIATFNKFSIELMNLGAPLWFIQLSQNAALDEINHTKIMLDILNKNGTECIEIGKFPNHEIEFNGDCNAISLDVVNGGCFGETESSINTMMESRKIEQLYSVAVDEVRHSALAWISVKWMINNCENIDISDEKWWDNKLKEHQLSVITKIYQQFWNFEGNDYQNLYNIIHDILYKEVSAIHQK